MKKKMLLYLALRSSNERLPSEEVDGKMIIIMIVSFLLSLELEEPRLKSFSVCLSEKYKKCHCELWARLLFGHVSARSL